LIAASRHAGCCSGCAAQPLQFTARDGACSARCCILLTQLAAASQLAMQYAGLPAVRQASLFASFEVVHHCNAECNLRRLMQAHRHQHMAVRPEKQPQPRGHVNRGHVNSTATLSGRKCNARGDAWIRVHVGGNNHSASTQLLAIGQQLHLSPGLAGGGTVTVTAFDNVVTAQHGVDRAAATQAP